MTLKDFYETIGSDYNAALTRMGKSEKMLSKFVRKFPKDPSAQQLFDAYESQDFQLAFRMAHTLKGVCSNLGLDKLQKSSAELTEALRNTVADNAPALMDQVRADYQMTLDALNQLDPE